MSANEESITERQLSYIKSLIEKRDVSPLSTEQKLFLSVEDNLLLLSKKQASAAIKALLGCNMKPVQPAQPAQPVSEPAQASEPEISTDDGTVENQEVPEGYFYIVDPKDNTEKFYRVTKGRPDTRWAGYTFLSVQASDYFYAIKEKPYRDRIFAEILKDPVTAMNEYGMRLGRCGVCNRTLTDRDSRLRGIGPICAERLYGQANDEEVDILSQLGLLDK
jgi:hypothetical protein